jgi:hypothetical protein
MLEVEKFTRRPFDVDAVRVTEDNLDEVAKWCQGEVRRTPSSERSRWPRYVYVRVHHPRTPRDNKAFPGNWVVYADGQGFKVYPHGAFDWSFERKTD